MSGPDLADALAAGRYDEVLSRTDAILAATPGNDAAHEHRARALLALGRLDEAERHAQDAVRLDPEAREALADARWLSGQEAPAFDEFRALANERTGRDRERLIRKARDLYRRRSGALGRLVASVGPLFDLAFRNGWLRIGR